MTAPSAAGEGQPEVTLISDEAFLSLFSGILEPTTNINHVSRRIKAVFTNMWSRNVWICLALLYCFFCTRSGKLQPEDGNQVSALPLFDSMNAQILTEKFKRMIWLTA